jgi:hypothetical protein
MRRRHSDQPALITTAPRTPDEEYEHRRRKYALMMGIRAVCVLAAALTYKVSIILALAFVVGGAVLPWCAVIIANDGPPKKRRPAPYRGANGERALPPAPDEKRIVDG